MEINDLRIFSERTIAYFGKVSGVEATAGVPRILQKEEEEVLLPITGAIGVTGNIQGAVYITGPEDFFRDLLKTFNPEADPSRENVLDVAGEVANTIAGNAQSVFGSGFRISIPMIITGKEQKIHMKEPRYLIPVHWQSHAFYLVIGLGKNSA